MRVSEYMQRNTRMAPGRAASLHQHEQDGSPSRETSQTGTPFELQQERLIFSELSSDLLL
jgi:hypothetical protein